MKKEIKKFLIMASICCLACMLFVAGCGRKEKHEELVWPTVGMSTMLPEIEGRLGEVIANNDDNFFVNLYEFSEEEKVL